MPDELCRKCGFELQIYLKCTECRRPSQFICHNCGKKTHYQVHYNCNISKDDPLQEAFFNNISVA